MLILLWSLLIISAFHQNKCQAEDRPHIIFFLADDLGFNDVGYQNPEVITPNIDQLAAEGVILDRNYVQPVCSPSRSALMTGMYPYKIGRQGTTPLGPRQPTGLTLDLTLLPEYLQNSGYTTHMVGKWHLGFCKREYTPPSRGFDSFYGYWGPSEDYYTKIVHAAPNEEALDNRDFFLNDDPVSDSGEYSMDLYTLRIKNIISSHNASAAPFFLYASSQNVHTPLQVPQIYEDMYPDEEDSDRRTYLGMVTRMDEMFGTVIDELKKNGMYDNSIIIFSSDNGGNTRNGGASNLPLKGQKGTYYEGGVRVPAFVHSPRYVENPGRIHDKLVHITDWLPTILRIADIEQNPNEDILDGVDQYDSVFGDESESNPRSMVVNDVATKRESIFKGAFQRDGGWKYLQNPDMGPATTYALYNVFDDPNETEELSQVYPDIFDSMKLEFEELVQNMVPEDKPPNIEGSLGDENNNVITGWC